MPKAKIKKRILTGDRPTGPLHLGHYVGSLENRVKLQDKYECFFIISDYAYITDRLVETKKLNNNVKSLVLDYLSVGIDPKKSTIYVQSKIPQVAELALLFSMMVTLSRLKRNPTIKEEIKDRGISKVSYGFMGWPIIQAADILCVRADLVPVGEDQVPHIEQTREIARDFNRMFGRIFPIPEVLTGKVARLPGLDGRKMSKSLGNAINLSDSPKQIKEKINRAITDPKRIHSFDKGHPEICNIFQYYKAFNREELSEIKEKCQKGKIGCVACKEKMTKAINEFLEPIRERRNFYEKKKDIVKEILNSGNKKTEKETAKTLTLVKEKMHLDYKSLL
ncbi:tryptophan--tRNA ligase [Candidatus Parcubacteria bacterium]|nr:tryptophan--tRNA ligase [Candidatus Parcubacteria bacterium]